MYLITKNQLLENHLLISYDDVSTMFHEFGHTLHGFLPTKNTLPFLAPMYQEIL
jgi:Zn-dependent oligopeptidase